MEKSKLQKEVLNELPEMNEMSGEILDFSELSNITGGNSTAPTTGCSAIFSGSCSTTPAQK